MRLEVHLPAPEPSPPTQPWRLDLGANLTREGVRFRVWAPAASQVDVLITAPVTGEAITPMTRRADGTWTALVPGEAGLRYRYRLDGSDAFPDPYSRFQPEGVHGASELVDPDVFEWHDTGWQGLAMPGLVIYEAHVGTATPEGSFEALQQQLPRLERLGVSAIEIMPVAEFSGTRNWGYDGVDLFAVSRNYGGPEAFRRFVDAAHQQGLGVILDVVYNHFGPEGNYLRNFSSSYFTSRYQTPWGEAVNFDGPGSEWVRKLVLDNARYWLHEYHVDGLRLDAVHEIQDASPRHLLAELTDTVRDSRVGQSSRRVVLIAETDENSVRYLRPTADGGYGLDAVWADDFHHATRRYLLGDAEGYYQDYAGTLEEVARTAAQGWLYEGQHSAHQARPRGTPARDQPAWQFVFCLQNHDQVGNRPLGDRLHHTLDLERYRAASAVLLLLPETPLLFMGQEFAASSPFQYFTDHSGDLGALVTEGRRREFGAFAAFADPASRDAIPDPQAVATFQRSKLNPNEVLRQPGAGVHRLYQVLLALRQSDPVLARQDRYALHLRALSPHVLAAHWWHGTSERLLLANFGELTSADLQAVTGRRAAASPAREQSSPRVTSLPWLQAPTISPGNGADHGVADESWFVILDTAERRFGGPGAGAAIERGLLALPARTAVVLAAEGRAA